MAQLYLPLAHTEADLVLAGQLAELLDSAELYVAWTPENGRTVPEVVAELRVAVPRWAAAIAVFFQLMRELWAALRNRDPQRPALAPPPLGEQTAQAPGEAAA